MNHHNEFSFSRTAMVCAAIAGAIFTSAPILAQQKPLVIEPNATGAAAVKAQSVISKPGSYVLNKNITNTSKNGQDSVAVTAPNVTIDLQGFVISATGSNTGVGINATGQSNVVIRNGIITGFDGPAIIGGTAANISGITATGDASAGGGASIQAGNGSQILDNTVTTGGAVGISCLVGCLARDNVLQANTGFGMTFSDPTSGYLGNVLQGNSGKTVGTDGQVSGGTSLNQNLCNGTTC